MDKKKKCIIFAGSPDDRCDRVSFDTDSFVICADGGYRTAKRLKITPDIIIGDLDTYKGALPGDTQVLRYPPQKDDTDTMLAVKLALEKGYDHLTIAGALGGRFDHMAANIQTLRYIIKNGAYGEIVSNDNIITMQQPGIRVYGKKHGYYFSVFAYSEECRGVTLTGFEYPMKDGVIKSSFPIGVSNRIVGRSGVVAVEKGVLLIVFSRDSNNS